MPVIVRGWNKEGYHKDLAFLDADQVRISHVGMEPTSKHIRGGEGAAPRVVFDPSLFPEIVELEVICIKYV